MTLGDGFNRRKKLAADLQSWTNRLGSAGRDTRVYRTLTVEGDNAFVPEPGTERVTRRHYTIEECDEAIRALVAEDQEIALRISLTNQRARARVVDLAGRERGLSVPELLVLKNDVIPRLEQLARAMPTIAESVSVFETGDGFVRHRTIKRIERKKETLTDKGLKIEEVITEGYDVGEVTDYGRSLRGVYNEVDRIHDFAERVKQAINEANKAELVELPNDANVG